MDNYSKSEKEYEQRPSEDSIITLTPFGVESVNKSDITEWSVSIDHWSKWHCLKQLRCLNGFPATLPIAVDQALQGGRTGVIPTDGSVRMYVFVPEDVFKPEESKVDDVTMVPVGEIEVKADGSYKWVLEYPLAITADNLLVSKMLDKSEAMAISGINPIISGGRAFMINTGYPSPDNLILTTDPESDQGLVVNNKGYLEVVTIPNIPIKKIYEFTGPKNYISKLASLYEQGVSVDNLYTALTGRDLLVEDQLDYDMDFKEYNYDLLEATFESRCATLRDEIMEALYKVGNAQLPHLPSIREDANIRKYKTIKNDLSIREDFDGYYYHSQLSGRRSASVDSPSALTETMLLSIM